MKRDFFSINYSIYVYNFFEFRYGALKEYEKNYMPLRIMSVKLARKVSTKNPMATLMVCIINLLPFVLKLARKMV